MIPISSRWQNFPDRHLRRVLYPAGREQQGFGFPGAATPPGHLGHLRTPTCHTRGCVCSISTPSSLATAAVTSSTIPVPAPWLIPLIPSAEEAPDLDHNKDQGNPGSGHGAAKGDYQAVTCSWPRLQMLIPKARGEGQRRAGHRGQAEFPVRLLPSLAFTLWHPAAATANQTWNYLCFKRG